MSIYWYYFLQFIRSKAEYRFDFLIGILTHLLIASFGLLFVVFLVDGKVITGIGDWSRDQILFIYGYSMLPLSLFNAVSSNLYRFGDKYVNGGQFDRVLLRPLSTVGQIIFESFNLEAVGTFILGIVIITNTASSLHLSFSLLDYLWAIISIFSGALILISIFIILAALSFFYDDKLGIGAPVYSLITFGRYPVTIFNKPIQIILSFVIPFAFVTFYPATYFLRREEFAFYCFLTPVIALITLLISLLVWRKGVSLYTSSGF